MNKIKMASIPFQKTCYICCENFNKSNRKEVICGFCPKQNEFLACVSCVKRYLLETTQNAHCMNCKHEWNRIFIYEQLPKVFLNIEYKKRRQDLIEERERSMMPATQPYVEIALLKRKLNDIGREISVLKNKLYVTNIFSDTHLELEIERVKLEHVFNCLGNEIRQKDNQKTKESRAQFIRQCPMEDCRGFLSTGWKCGICKTRVCSHCHEPKLEFKEGESKEGENHICNPDNIETAKLLKNDSKPCPKCACMIFKISGCDQMFCTQCHTAFSWVSGRIETRIIHNPHYFQYLREQANGGEIPRNPLDNPCAEIMPDGEAFNTQMIQYIQTKLRNIPSFIQEDPVLDGIKCNIRISEEIAKVIQLCNHIVANHYQNEHAMNDNLDLRVKFMIHELTDEKYKQLLQIREKNNEKTHEFDMIFRTYVVAARDIILNFVNLSEKSDQTNTQQIVYNELMNLRNYINDCFRRLIPVFNNSVWYISAHRTRYLLDRIKS
jgi:hypothetical protein